MSVIGRRHKFDAEILRELASVTQAARGRIRTRHGHAKYVFAAQRSDRNDCDKCGIHAATKPYNDFLEATLTYVVSRTDHQGA